MDEIRSEQEVHDDILSIRYLGICMASCLATRVTKQDILLDEQVAALRTTLAETPGCMTCPNIQNRPSCKDPGAKHSSQTAEGM